MTNKLRATDRIGFHEASIVGVKREQGSIYISLEGVHVNGDVRNAAVCLKGIREILQDGVQITDIEMEYPDGEVLTLECTSGSVSLFVQWNDFARHLERTRGYRVSCDSVEIDVT